MTDKSNDYIPAAMSDIGCEREINEDRYALVDTQTGLAWIVCDGMGGEMGGDLAAQLAIDAIKRVLESAAVIEPKAVLKEAVEEANRVIALRRQNQTFSSMGTTIVIAYSKGSEWVIGHAGDSRAYLIREGKASQLTTDHTYVQSLVSQGEITEEEALNHPQSHVLTRCLGAHPVLELDTLRLWKWGLEREQSSDVLVLCSDGLYSLVSEEEISSAVMELTPQEACVEMVELARSRGGYDNITVAVVPIGGQLKEERSAVVETLEKSTQTLESLNFRDSVLPIVSNLAYLAMAAVTGSLLAAAGLVWFLTKV